MTEPDVTLHEFMANNRAALLATVVEKVRRRAPGRPDEELLAGTGEVLDEIVKSLRRAAGVPDDTPKPDQAGISLGRFRHESFDDISVVAFSIGAISDSLGELGGRQGLRFAAREYQVFNQAIDESTAAAIDEFQRRDRAVQRREHSKRVGFLAHEIRNAVTVGQMAYATLKRGAVGINSKTGDIVGRSFANILALVRQTLAAVQLEADVPIARSRIDVAELVRQLDAGAVPERGVTVRWEVEPELFAHGDDRLLLSAASNLLQNAFKFTRENGTVLVRSRRHGDLVRLEVEDECGGLPPGSEEALLAAFSQQHDDRRGLGLGLPISQEAMEAQGGRLTITNLPGKGCIFSLEVPAAPG
jgi:signal transduction histidine kinase